MSVDIPTFRQTMGLFPGAVTLITTGTGDLRRGITATAVCSVSDSPPSLLVCVNRMTGTYAEIERSGQFSVQLLDQIHADVAMAFAGAQGRSGVSKFDLGDWETCFRGLPRLRGALASISCEVITSTETGSHSIFVGQMEEVTVSPGEPLIYARAKFHRLALAS
jgi:flavin reductase (DIM6/NTAB) family NADH-FMN oxidoreductase RutF